MSNKKGMKDVNELLGKLGDIDNQLSKFKEGMKEATDKVSDSFNFRDLSSTISKLEKMSVNVNGTQYNNNTTVPPVEGETCMHGNSWNSNCSDCDTTDTIETQLQTIWDIVEVTPNDKELGKIIREEYFQWKKATPDSDDYPYNTEFGSGKTAQEMEAIDEDNRQTELFDNKPNPNQLELF